MMKSRNNASAVSAQNDPMPTDDSMSVDQYLEQLHADFDPVYSLLTDYQCAVMEVETKFNILNSRLSMQGEHNPIESIKSRVKDFDSIIRKLDKLHLPITVEAVEENLRDVAGVRVICAFIDDIYKIESNCSVHPRHSAGTEQLPTRYACKKMRRRSSGSFRNSCVLLEMSKTQG